MMGYKVCNAYSGVRDQDNSHRNANEGGEIAHMQIPSRFHGRLCAMEEFGITILDVLHMGRSGRIKPGKNGNPVEGKHSKVLSCLMILISNRRCDNTREMDQETITSISESSKECKSR